MNRVESEWAIALMGTEPQAIRGPPGFTGENAGFLRSDSTRGLSVVALVVVTDEEDCSSANSAHFRPPALLNPSVPGDAELLMQGLNVRCHFNQQNLFPVDRYINGFKALRPGNEQLVVFSAIVGVPPETVAAIPADFAENGAARDAFYEGILNHPRMQPTVDTKGTPDPQDDNVTASCDTASGRAYAPHRIVQVARGFGPNGIVQSICQEDFGPAMDAVIERVSSALAPNCLPRPLMRNARFLVDCDVLWELPPAGLAPATTPTTCAQLPDLLLPADGDSARGGEVCRLAQLAVNGSGSLVLTPTVHDGKSFTNGWYYDDFSNEVMVECSAGAQRIAFTPEAEVPDGVRVYLDCAQ